MLIRVFDGGSNQSEYFERPRWNFFFIEHKLVFYNFKWALNVFRISVSRCAQLLVTLTNLKMFQNKNIYKFH